MFDTCSLELKQASINLATVFSTTITHLSDDALNSSASLRLLPCCRTKVLAWILVLVGDAVELELVVGVCEGNT